MERSIRDIMSNNTMSRQKRCIRQNCLSQIETWVLSGIFRHAYNSEIYEVGNTELRQYL